jgi:hypothetical protein
MADGQGNFTIIRDDGEEIRYDPYHGSLVHPTREAAKRAALDGARGEIDKLQPTQH